MSMNALHLHGGGGGGNDPTSTMMKVQIPVLIGLSISMAMSYSYSMILLDNNDAFRRQLTLALMTLRLRLRLGSSNSSTSTSTSTAKGDNDNDNGNEGRFRFRFFGLKMKLLVNIFSLSLSPLALYRKRREMLRRSLKESIAIALLDMRMRMRMRMRNVRVNLESAEATEVEVIATKKKKKDSEDSSIMEESIEGIEMKQKMEQIMNDIIVSGLPFTIVGIVETSSRRTCSESESESESETETETKIDEDGKQHADDDSYSYNYHMNCSDKENKVGILYLHLALRVRVQADNDNDDSDNDNDNDNDDASTTNTKGDSGSTEKDTYQLGRRRSRRHPKDRDRDQTSTSTTASFCYKYRYRHIHLPLLPFCNLLKAEFEQKLTSHTICFIADASSSHAIEVFTRILIQSSLLRVEMEPDDDDGITDDGSDYDNDNDNDEDKRYDRNHAIVKEPLWMSLLAIMIQDGIVKTSEAKTILYALVQLETYQYRYKNSRSRRRGQGQGQGQQHQKHRYPYHLHKTIVVTLPGQGCTAAILPLLHQIFPHERHVFAYTGCVAAVDYSMNMNMNIKKRRKAPSKYRKTRWDGQCHDNDNDNDTKSGVTAIQLRNNCATVPITPLRLKSDGDSICDSTFTFTFTKKDQMFTECLAKLPDPNVAGIVEAWMSSVDTFLALKKQDNNKHIASSNADSYVPFVFRLQYLLDESEMAKMIPTGEIRSMKANSDAEISGDCDTHHRLSGIANKENKIQINNTHINLALMNALEYITGTRTRPLNGMHLQAAQSSLKDILQEQKSRLVGQNTPGSGKREKVDLNTRVAIENCIFCHKGILIGDHILQDTVVPHVNWSLKAASADDDSCACCFPGVGVLENRILDSVAIELDNDGDGELRLEDTIYELGDQGGDEDEVSGFSGIGGGINRSGFVDGKTGFAFDPTNFTD